jgi:hypothetical protein
MLKQTLDLITLHFSDPSSPDYDTWDSVPLLVYLIFASWQVKYSRAKFSNSKMRPHSSGFFARSRAGYTISAIHYEKWPRTLLLCLQMNFRGKIEVCEEKFSCLMIWAIYFVRIASAVRCLDHFFNLKLSHICCFPITYS